MPEAVALLQPDVAQAAKLSAGNVAEFFRESWARFNQPETYQKTLTVLATAHFASVLFRLGATLAGEYTHTHPQEMQAAKAFLADLFAQTGFHDSLNNGGGSEQGLLFLQSTPEPTPSELYIGSCTIEDGNLYQQLGPNGGSLADIANYYHVDLAQLISANPGVETDADLIGCSCLKIPVPDPQALIDNIPSFSEDYCPGVTSPEYYVNASQADATAVSTMESLSSSTPTPEEMATINSTALETSEATPAFNIPQATEVDNYAGESLVEIIGAGIVSVLSGPAVISAGSGILNMFSSILAGRRSELLSKLADFRVTYGFYGKILSGLGKVYNDHINPNDPNGQH